MKHTFKTQAVIFWLIVLLAGLITAGCLIKYFKPAKEAKVRNQGIKTDLSLSYKQEKITFTIGESNYQKQQREVVAREASDTRYNSEIPNNLNSIQELAKSMVGEEQFTCLDNLITRESGWSPTVTNQSSGAAGLFQNIRGFSEDYKYGDENSQLEWGINYIKNRYGSSCEAWEFWQNNQYY